MISFEGECEARYGRSATKIHLLDNYRSRSHRWFYESYMNSQPMLKLKVISGCARTVHLPLKPRLSYPSVWLAQGADSKEADDKLVEFVSSLVKCRLLRIGPKWQLPSVNEATLNVWVI